MGSWALGERQGGRAGVRLPGNRGKVPPGWRPQAPRQNKVGIKEHSPSPATNLWAVLGTKKTGPN